MTTGPIEIDVISDVMCPWCYIGKRRLERALAERPSLSVDIRWRPYQLDATIDDEATFDWPTDEVLRPAGIGLSQLATIAWSDAASREYLPVMLVDASEPGSSAGFSQLVLTVESTIPDYQACVDALSDIDEPIYGLVHLAGLIERDQELAAEHDVWDRAIANNLANAYDMATAVAERFDTSVMSRLVFVSSLAFRRGGVDFVSYSAAKGGIIGLVRALARRLADQALVNAVAPGVIETPLTADLRARKAEKLLGEIPLGRFGHPREVASVIAFLLSEDSSYVTGQCINIDGGTINA